MKFKRLISVVIIFCISVVMILPVNAVQEKSISDKARTLNTFSVLKGNAVDFNLDGQLNRGEAAAFIIRLMGVEADVLNDSSIWSGTKFKDVEKNKWYAPYIGYCSEAGIIGGYPNGNYGPDDNISEKAFLKLVLGVLGYKYNIDFNWDNVYIAALNAGLITDTAYKNKKSDDANYKRSSVVNVLYNSLAKSNKVTKVTILDNLINTKVIDRETAILEGLISDTVITAISQIYTVDSNNIKVKFNESVKNLDSSKIQVFETQNALSKLSLTIKSQGADEIILSTSAQIPDKDYTITISGVEDQENNILDLLTATFTGYRSLEVNSDFFRINKIEAVSKNVIDVFFTQPINMNVEIPLSYEILLGDTSYIKGSFQTASVRVLAPYENAVSIFLKEKDLQEGVYYTLKLTGDLSSAYSVKLNDGSGDSMGFIAKGTANEGFYVTNVMPINKKYVKVQFNKDIDASSAQLNTNYTFKDSNGISGGIIKSVVTKEGLMKNKEVVLEVAPLLGSSKQYVLTINNIYDSFRQIQLDTNSTYPFTGVSTEIEDLAIINIFAEDKGTLDVYFNKPLSITTAVDQFRYTITGVTNPAYVVNPSHIYYDSELNPYMAKLFIPGDTITGSSTYQLKVDKFMQDYLGDISANDTLLSFTGSNIDNIKPFMVEAKIISSDTIKVILNKEISSGGINTLPYNYSLEYNDGSNTIAKNPTSVSYLNATTLLMKFSSLDFSKAYILKFTNMLTDYTGINSRLASDSLNGISVYLGN